MMWKRPSAEPDRDEEAELVLHRRRNRIWKYVVICLAPMAAMAAMFFAGSLFLANAVDSFGKRDFEDARPADRQRLTVLAKESVLALRPEGFRFDTLRKTLPGCSTAAISQVQSCTGTQIQAYYTRLSPNVGSIDDFEAALRSSGWVL